MAWRRTSDLEKLHRLLDNIQILNGCWEWKGFRNPGGYGRYKWRQRNWLAHRLVWHLFMGEVTDNCICHRCDNRECVRPSHLFSGTQAENIHDMGRKGRKRGAVGIRNPNAKLNSNLVDEIRALYKGGLTQVVLGERFGVDFSTIGRIIRNETWRTE